MCHLLPFFGTTPRLEQRSAGRGRCLKGPWMQLALTFFLQFCLNNVCVGGEEVACIHGLSWPYVADVNAVLYAVKQPGNPSHVKVVALKLRVS